MLPTHINQMGRGPGRFVPIGRIRMRRARSVTRDVWFYAAEASSQSAPSKLVLSQIMADDNTRLSKSPGPYARQQRPRSKRLRCMLCLREMREWVTWDNSNEESSWREFNNHLRGVHLITCTPAVPRSSQSYIPPVVRSSNAPSYPKSISNPAPSTSTMPTRPPNQRLLPPAPSTSSRREIQVASESRRKGPGISFEDAGRGDDESETDSELMDDTEDSETETTSELTDSSDDSDSETGSKMQDTESGPPLRLGLTKMVKMLGDELDRARAKYKRVTAERDRITAERDHEAKSRRLLEGEVLRLNGEARARNEELLAQTRLIAELVQDLRHALAQGRSSS